jgi:Mg-chelatase subunit ChlI
VKSRAIPRTLLDERRCLECGCRFARWPNDGGKVCGYCVAALEPVKVRAA